MVELKCESQMFGGQVTMLCDKEDFIYYMNTCRAPHLEMSPSGGSAQKQRIAYVTQRYWVTVASHSAA